MSELKASLYQEFAELSPEETWAKDFLAIAAIVRDDIEDTQVLLNKLTSYVQHSRKGGL
tara:strand:- start:715 stop:891 length:177 start_codon:yes stop_codon:yes gene_type:complete